MFDADELFTRRSGAGAGSLGFLDLAPVVIVGRHDAAARQEALEAHGAGAVVGASRGHCRGDLIGDFVAVGPIGSDRSGWTTPGPADGIEPVGDPAPFVEEF